MTRQLVFVHGRAQEFKDATKLKGEWVRAWREGLAKSGLDLPISEADIRFPYYGQTLYDLVEGDDEKDAAAVVVRSRRAPGEEQRFIAAVLEEARRESGVAAAGSRRGPLNWDWIQELMEALDTHLPGASGTSIALTTYDVYHYLRNPGVRDAIERGVRSALRADVETVVVGHSLGSVVAYSLLRRDGAALNLRVPLFVTVGSPLAVTEIKKSLWPIGHPSCVEKWFNAMDDRDVVSLYPLDGRRFPVHPPIENKTDVNNHTKNRHGIAGYLDDRVVARRIYEALVEE